MIKKIFKSEEVQIRLWVVCADTGLAVFFSLFGDKTAVVRNFLICCAMMGLLSLISEVINEHSNIKNGKAAKK